MRRPFEEIFDDQTKLGTKVQTDEYHESGAHIIVDQSQKQIAGYTDREEGIFCAVPAIIFGDHTRIIKYVDEPFFLGADGVKVLRCKIPGANYRYLYYALRHAKIPNTGYNRHFKWLKEVLIACPDAKQQAEIVTILDGIGRIIAARQRQLRTLDALIKARFVEMFGAYNADCCNKTIGDYAQVLGGYAFKSDEFIQDAIPVIRISNINEGQIIPDHTVCFNEQFWFNNPRFRAEPGDILMAMSGATTGKAGILRKNEKLLINQRVACIRAKEGRSLPEFIYAATQLSWMYDLIQNKSAGCAQPNISGKQIENMPLPEATYIQQKEFAAFVSQIDKSKVAVQTALEKAQLLFDSLMQQYFG